MLSTTVEEHIVAAPVIEPYRVQAFPFLPRLPRLRHPLGCIPRIHPRGNGQDDELPLLPRRQAPHGAPRPERGVDDRLGRNLQSLRRPYRPAPAPHLQLLWPAPGTDQYEQLRDAFYGGVLVALHWDHGLLRQELAEFGAAKKAALAKGKPDA